MADRYWVGGTGTWNTTNNWSTSSGGPGGASIPTSSDSVFFDQASTYTVTVGITGGAQCLDITVSAGTVTFQDGVTNSLFVHGNLSFVAGTVWNLTGELRFPGSSSITINTGGTTISSPLSFTGTGTYTLTNNLTVASTRTTTLTSGTLALGSFTLTTGNFSSSNSNTRTLDFGTGKIVLNSATTGTIWNASAVTNLTVSGTPLVECIGGGTAVTKTINTGALSEANAISFSFLETTGTVTYTFTTGTSFKNLTFNGVQTISNIAVNIFGSFTHQTAGGTTTFTAGTNAWTFAATSGSYNITNIAGFTYDFPWTFGSTATAQSTATWTLVNNLTLGATRQLTLANGTTDFNNKTLSAQGITINGSTRTATLINTGGGGSFTTSLLITHTSGGLTLGVNVNATNASGYTLTAGTLALSTFTLATPVFSSSGTGTRTLDFGTGKIVLNGSVTATVWNTATVTNLTVTGTSLVECIGGGTAVTKTINTGALSEANSINFSFLETTGTVTYTFTAGNSFRNLNITGPGSGATTTFSNIAINIFGSFTHTAGVGTVAFTAGTNAWTFSATSGSYNITNIAGFTYDFPWTFGSATSTATWTLVNNLTLGATRQLTLTNGTTDFNNKTLSAAGITIATGTPTIANTGGSGFNTTLPITHTSGTLTLTLNLTTTNASGYTFTAGTLALSTFTLTTPVFSSSNSNARTINFGTGKIVLNGGSGVTIWNTSTATNMTISGTSLVECVSSGLGTRTINAGAPGQANTVNFSLLGVRVGISADPTFAFTSSNNIKNLIVNGNQTISNIAINIFGSFTHLTTSGTTNFTAGTNAWTFAATSDSYNINNIAGFTYDFPWIFGSAASTATWTLANNLTLGATRQLTLTNGTTDFNNRTLSAQGITILTGTPTIANTGGSGFSTTLPITHSNGTLNLTLNVTTTNASGYTLNGGTLNLNTFTLTTTVFNSSVSFARTLNFGTGQLALTGNNTTIFNLANPTSFTTAGTVYINSTYTGATGTRIFTTSFTEAQAAGYDVKTSGTSGVVIGTTATDIVEFTGNWNNFDLTGLTNTLSNTTRTIYGNFTTSSSGGTITAGANATTFAGAGTELITTNGRTIPFPITLNSTGTTRLNDALTLSSTLTLTIASGTLDLNNLTLSTGALSSSTTGSRTIQFGTTGQIALTGNSLTILDFANATNLAYTGTVYFNCTYSGASGTRTLNLGSASQGAFSIGNAFNVSTSGTSGIVIGSGTDIISLNGFFNNVNLTSMTFTLANVNRTIHGNLTISAAGGTFAAGAGITTLATNGTQTVDTNNRSLDFPITIGNGTTTGTAQLISNLTLGTTRTLTLTSGTLDLNNLTATAGAFNYSGTSVRSIGFASTGQITLTASGTPIWDSTSGTNFSWTGTHRIFANFSGSTGTRTINFSTTAAAFTFNIGFAATAQANAFTIATSTDSLSITGNINNFDFTNSTNVLGNVARTIFGNFTVPAVGGTINSGTVATTFSGTSGTSIITTNGRSIPIPFTFDGAGKTFQIAGATTLTQTLTLTTGTLDLNNNTFTATLLSSSNANIRRILFGSTGQIVLTGNAATIMDFTIATNFTYTGTPRINSSYTGATGTRTFIFGQTVGYGAFPGNVFDVNIGGTTGLSIASATDSFALSGYFGNLDLTGLSSTHTLTNSTRVLFGNLTVPSTGGTLSAGTNLTTLSAPPAIPVENGYSFHMGPNNTFAGGYLTLGAQTALSFDTGDFTIEAWVLPISSAGVYAAVIDTRTGASAQTWRCGLVPTSGAYRLDFYTGTSYTGATIVNLHTWTHVAITRSSGTLRLFVNGVLDTTWNNVTGNINASSATQFIGTGRENNAYFPGNISNLRVVKGTAVYTNNFTPSTSPLTTTSQGVSPSNVSLLTCQSTTIIDNSPNNFTITPVLAAGNHVGASYLNPFNNVPGVTTVTTNGRTLDFPVRVGEFTNGGGIVRILGATTIGTSRTLSLINGTLDLNNFTFTSGLFSDSDSESRAANRSFSFGTSGQVSLTGNLATIIDIPIGTNFSWTGTPRIVSTYAAGTGTRTFNLGTTTPINSSFLFDVIIGAGTGISLSASATDSIVLSGGFNNVDLRGMLNTLTNTTRSIAGSFRTSATGGTYTAGTSVTTFIGNTSPYTIDTATRSLDFPFTFNGTSTWTIANTFTSGSSATVSTRALTLTTGNVSFNGVQVNCGQFSSSGTNARNLDFGANGRILLLNSGTTIWDTTTGTNFTWTGNFDVDSNFTGSAGTRTINFGTLAEQFAPNVQVATAGAGFGLNTGTDSVALSGNTGSLNLTNFAGTLTNAARNVHGDLTFPVSGGTFTGGTAVTTLAATSGTEIITYNGRTINFPLTINGPGGTFVANGNILMSTANTLTLTNGHFNANLANIVASTITVVNSNAAVSNLSTTLTITHTSGNLNLNSNVSTGDYTLTAGNLNLNNYIVTTRTFSSSGTGVRGINFGDTGAVRLSVNTTATYWTTATPTNFAYTGNSRIITVGGGNVTKTINTGTMTESQAMNWDLRDTAGRITFTSSNAVRNLNANGSFVLTNVPLTIYGNYTYDSSYTAGYASVFFGGTSDYLAFANDAANRMDTGDFTAEGWVYLTSHTLANPLWAKGGDNVNDWFFGAVETSGRLIFGIGANTYFGTTGPVVPLNSWNHIAVVRTGTTFTTYLNGATANTVTGISNNLNTSGELRIGRGRDTSTNYLSGYVSNARLVKGTALYTGAFTPSTTPLTVVANTSVLTCRSNELADISNNNFAITSFGIVTPNYFNPFNSTANGTAILGGTNAWTFASSNTQNITSNSFWHDFPFTFAGTGTASLQDDLTLNGTRTTTLTSGTLNLNDRNLRTGIFSSTNSNARSIGFANTGKITLISNTAVTYWTTATPTNFSFTGNSNIETASSGAVTKTINTGTVLESQSLNFNIRDTAGTVAFTSANGVRNLNLNGAFTLSNIPITIYGDYVYTAATALTAGTNAWTFDGGTPSYINGGGITHDFPWTILKDSDLILQGATTIGSTRTTSYRKGTFDLNGYNYTTGLFDIGYSGESALPSSFYFDGNGDYLSTGSSNLIISTDSFTVECWVYPITGGDPNGGVISSAHQDTGTGISLSIDQAWIGSSAVIVSYNWSSFVNLNQWNHLAMTRQGTTVRWFVNGALLRTTTDSSVISSSIVVIGRRYHNVNNFYLTGYVSNARIIKGTALYTSSFTPPTLPLTAILGTELLAAKSNAAIDESLNRLTITTHGNSTSSNVTPFLYNSVYFDGSGTDSLVVTTAGTNLTLGTEDFTLELWFYLPSFAAAGGFFFDFRTDQTQIRPTLYIDNAGPNIIKYFVNGADRIVSTTSPPLNVWNHLAIARSGTDTKLFLNGVQAGSTYTDTNNYVGSEVTVGNRFALNVPMLQYISNFRIIKGTALYTSNFVPPISTLTAVANTTLLTCQNTYFKDNSNNNFTITVNGNPTADIKNPFLNSVLFDGNEDALSFPANSAFSFGTGDFTIEAWVYPTTLDASYNDIITFAFSVGGSTFAFLNGVLIAYRFQTSTPTIVSSSYTASLNTWQHVSLVRQSGTLKMFANGVEVYSGPSTGDYINNGTNYIGSWTLTSSEEFSGYISNLRVLKGTALYTSNFTPSLIPLTSVANTSLLTCTGGNFEDFSNNNFTITKIGNVALDDSNPFTISINDSDKTLQFSNGGTITITGSGSNTFNNQVTGGIDIEVSNGNAVISMTSSSSKMFNGNNINYSPIILNQGGTGQLFVRGNNSFKDISASITATSNATILLEANTTTTFNTFTLSGNTVSLRYPTLNSNTEGFKANVASNTSSNGIYNTGTDYIFCRNIGFVPYNSDGSDYVRWFVGANSISLNNNAGALFQNYNANNFNKVYIIEANTRWTVPEDFNVSNNTIHLFGAGGGGGLRGGGGGGGYTRVSNTYFHGNQTIFFEIGSAGTAIPLSNGGPTKLLTWYGNYTANGGNRAGNGSANTILGGLGGVGATANGGTGGQGTSGTGSVVLLSGGGGGGAGGPLGNGGNGGNGNTADANENSAGGGGGGNGGGTNGQNASGATGGSGGNNAIGFGRGVGTTSDGSLSFSGGGAAGAGKDSGSRTGVGSTGIEILNSFGGGGGGGGATGRTTVAQYGGLGGKFGGGGGGGGLRNTAESPGGNGGSGGAIIIYKPDTAPKTTRDFMFMFQGKSGNTPSYTLDYLVVAGGGGGGTGDSSNQWSGGGGGAGGLLNGNLIVNSSSLRSGTTLTITVGAGGTGLIMNNGNSSNTTLARGANSSISATGFTEQLARGGGQGGGLYSVNNGIGPGAGGSGGGHYSSPGGSGITGQGNNGGSGTGSFASNKSGGGGGAGAVGGNAGALGGNGGVGIESTITGSSVFYAGGGGGGSKGSAGGSGGNGGGGQGGGEGAGVPTASAGSPNTGGGGGGVPNASIAGRSGGSGIVVLRHSDNLPQAITTGSPTITVSGGFRIYTFTGSGTFTVP